MNSKKKQENFFCEIDRAVKLKKSKIIRFRNKRWQNIKSVPYKTKEGNWHSIERFPLIKTDDAKFEVRYFEIAPGGCSSLEYHQHSHVVICLKGKGKVRLGKKNHILKYLDILYIAPNEIHQLFNPFREPFGFLCIVDSERDKPVEINER
ncbi:Cupin domain protein [Thermodesulfovibrio aggregans]|uniref:Cupin domain protein n=1 Tax=Thermodesulfovibrio aggregans TaxID=86166 RepID=A0A0U9I8G6_9BACT|nr:cupin domain-containing protein [Thermodesulfovibrio aggregans]GAQ94006.1 Cupin domain protein [Thermodesulfovibrio aggregans]